MQIIFDPKCSVAKYAEQGKEFDFPELRRCQNRRCRSQTVHKHGFYERNKAVVQIISQKNTLQGILGSWIPFSDR